MHYALKAAPSSEKIPSAPAGSRVLRLSRIRCHVEKIINHIAARMSGDLGEDDCIQSLQLHGRYTGFEGHDVTPENETIVSAPYGEILEIKGGR